MFFYEVIIDDMHGGEYPSVSEFWASIRELSKAELDEVYDEIYRLAKPEDQFNDVWEASKTVMERFGLIKVQVTGTVELTCNA